MIGDIIELEDTEFHLEDPVYDLLNPSSPSKLEKATKIEPLLTIKMKKGRLTRTDLDWRSARKKMEQDIQQLPEQSKKLSNPRHYRMFLSQSLFDLGLKLIERYSPKKT